MFLISVTPYFCGRVPCNSRDGSMTLDGMAVTAQKCEHFGESTETPV
jgi:hypothetical protein